MGHKWRHSAFGLGICNLTPFRRALEWYGMKVSRWSEGYASDILEAFNGENSLNMTLKMHPEDTSKLLATLFNEFALNPDDFDLSVYYPRQSGVKIP